MVKRAAGSQSAAIDGCGRAAEVSGVAAERPSAEWPLAQAVQACHDNGDRMSRSKDGRPMNFLEYEARATRGQRLRARNGVTALIIGLAIAAMLSMAGPVAEATAKVTLPAGYHANGCTMSPDRGWFPIYYDFKNVCNRHDYCYDELWFGSGEKGRKRCDSQFLAEARGWCNKRYKSAVLAADRVACRGVAWVYYKAVRLFGKSYFNNPSKN